MSTTENIKQRAQEFCTAHGLHYACSSDNEWISIGQAGFYIEDVGGPEELLDTLNECKKEHEAIEKVEWEPGLLYRALHRVGDDPIKSGIEEELAQIFDDDTLNKIARVFHKYTCD